MPKTDLIRIDPQTLRRMRLEKWLSVVALARRARVSHGTVSQIQSGRWTSLRTAHRIAKALGVELGELASVAAVDRPSGAPVDHAAAGRERGQGQ